MPDYETYDVLDENRLVAFLTRESERIGIKSLTTKLFSSISEFIRDVEVVENELIQHKRLVSPFELRRAAQGGLFR